MQQDPQEMRASNAKDKCGLPAVLVWLFYLAVKGKQELGRLWDLGEARVAIRLALLKDDAGCTRE